MPSLGFEFKRPAPKPIKLMECWKSIGRFVYYVKHTYIHYSDRPEPPNTEITETFPTGQISDEQVALCKDIFDSVDERSNRLEEKANYLLAVVAFLLPVALSVGIYCVTKVDMQKLKYSILALDSIILFLLITAFIAAIKIITVKGRQSLYFFSVLNDNGSEIRAYDKAFYSRGLLWCASYNSAINDHVADYLRGCHIFIIVSISLLVITSMPALYYISSTKDVQDVQGTVSVTQSSLDLATFKNISSIRYDLEKIKMDIVITKELYRKGR